MSEARPKHLFYFGPVIWARPQRGWNWRAFELRVVLFSRDTPQGEELRGAVSFRIVLTGPGISWLINGPYTPGAIDSRAWTGRSIEKVFLRRWPSIHMRVFL